MVLNKEKVRDIYDKYSKGKTLKRSEKIFYQNIEGTRKSGLEYVFSNEELSEYVKCSIDFNYFIEKYLTNNIVLHDYQKKILEQYKNNRYSILLSSRQTGVDRLMMMIFLHYVLFNYDKSVLIFNYKRMLSSEQINIIKGYYKKLPFFLKKGIIKWNERYIVFDNGSRISFNNSRDPGLSSNWNIYYMNSFASYPKLEEFYSKIVPTISSLEDTKLIINSRPNGYNFFYDLVKNSEREESDPLKNSFKTLRTYWHQIPNRGEEWKREQIKLIGGEKMFQQKFDLMFFGYNKDSKGEEYDSDK